MEAAAMAEERAAVGVVGLGAMGAALAGALLGAGHQVVVWNRTPGKADALVGRGARRAADAAELLGAAPVVLVSLADDDVARAVLDAAGTAVRPGQVLVNLTSGTPAGARAWAAWAAERGASYLSGAVVALPQAVGSPKALLLTSGPAGARAAAEPALAALGRSVHLGADPALAPGHDIGLLSAMYGVLAGAQHAVAVVDAVGGDVGSFKDGLLAGWLREMVAFLVAESRPDGRVAAELGPAQQAASLRQILAASAGLGVPADRTGHLTSALAAMTRSVA
jgi:3-hydroxyisobutyrate dehydrogenase-like beta-hydroxyacid dehydrogenase